MLVITSEEVTEFDSSVLETCAWQEAQGCTQAMRDDYVDYGEELE